jgi:mannose-6-phosphate isomerase-like protein (cupin superfamily)
VSFVAFAVRFSEEFYRSQDGTTADENNQSFVVIRVNSWLFSGQENFFMHTIIRSGEIQASPGGTIKFEGEPYGSAVSFFHVNNEPGTGPGLHKHPYPETWVVRAGRGLFTADGIDVEAGPGDILVVGAETPHKFKNIGDGRLDVLCIHASPRIIQVELEDS